MRNRAVGSVLRSIRVLLEVGTSAGQSDSQLLERYLLRGDDAAEAAFRALVDRHGPMVLRACRGVLHDAHDAEDAFQATFLVLARKAGTIRKGDSVASWLFGVARRVSVRADGRRKRRAAHEAPGGAIIAMAEAPPPDGPPGPMPEVLEEVDRLPERYRVPVVLCYFEGLTQEEAANRLRLPASTVRVRLMRARTRLRDRLTRRGLAPASLVALSTAGRAEAAVPAPLVDETIGAATRFAAGRAAGVSAPVAALVQGVFRAMFLAKLKSAAALLAVLLLTSAWMLASFAGPAKSPPDPPPAVAQEPAPKPAAADTPRAKDQGLAVSVWTIRRADWKRKSAQVGTVTAFQSADLYARIPGYVKTLNVNIGSRVKKGDEIAELEAPEVRGRVRQGPGGGLWGEGRPPESCRRGRRGQGGRRGRKCQGRGRHLRGRRGQSQGRFAEEGARLYRATCRETLGLAKRGRPGDRQVCSGPIRRGRGPRKSRSPGPLRARRRRGSREPNPTSRTPGASSRSPRPPGIPPRSTCVIPGSPRRTTGS